MYRPLWKFR